MNKIVYCAKFVKSITFGDKLQKTPGEVWSLGEEVHTELNRGERLVLICLFLLLKLMLSFNTEEI
jgi:hypothetical protein